MSTIRKRTEEMSITTTNEWLVALARRTKRPKILQYFTSTLLLIYT